MLHSKTQRLFFWVALTYGSVIAAVLYPALHEELGLRVFLWNCLPPTLALTFILTGIQRSKPFFAASVGFALLTAIGALFLVAAWFFTSLDTDPHSVTTKFVFVFGPLFSLALAIIGSAIGWVIERLGRER